MKILQKIRQFWNKCTHHFRVHYLKGQFHNPLSRLLLLLIFVFSSTTETMRYFDTFVGKKIDFLARDSLGLSPHMDPKLKVFNLDDKALASLQGEDLDLEDWAAIFEVLIQSGASQIYVDKMFDLVNPAKNPKFAAFQQKMLEFGSKVHIGVYATSVKRVNRDTVSPPPQSYTIEMDSGLLSSPDQLAHYGKDQKPVYVYGARKKLMDQFGSPGHLVVTDDGYFHPVYYTQNKGLIPHLALVNSQIQLQKNRIHLDGALLNLADHKLLINILNHPGFLKKSYTMKGLIKYARKGRSIPVVNPGDTVLLIPAMYTGHADWRYTHLGVKPGGLIIASILNSRLTGDWLKLIELPVWFGVMLLFLMQQFIFPRKKMYNNLLIVILMPLAILCSGIVLFCLLSFSINWIIFASYSALNGILHLQSTIQRAEQEKLKVAVENSLIQKIQRNFLPSPLNHQNIQVEYVFMPAESAGGDILCIEQDANNDHLFVSIMDVTGHGIGAAMLTGVLTTAHRQSIKAMADANLSLEEKVKRVVNALNEAMYIKHENSIKIATGITLGIDLTKNEVHYSNSGHHPLYHYTSGKAKKISNPNDPLGIKESYKPSPKHLQIAPGDKLVLYTDGLFENTNSEGKPVSKAKWIKKMTDESCITLLPKMTQEALDFWGKYPFEDDVTIIMIDFQKKIQGHL